MKLVRFCVAALACTAAWRGNAVAQSDRQIAAWDGLSLSPIGALAPLARIPGDLAAGTSDLSLRYGRWRYDPDDAVHDTFGVTWGHGIRSSGLRFEITAAYALVECPTCSGSLMGGIELESTLLQRGAMESGANSVRTSLGLRVSLGGASELGTERTTAGSTAILLPMDLALPLGNGSSVGVSLQPGIGYGYTASPDFGDGGVLPMVGAALALHTGPGIGVHLGVQRIFIPGGPMTIGASFSWKLR